MIDVLTSKKYNKSFKKKDKFIQSKAFGRDWQGEFEWVTGNFE